METPGGNRLTPIAIMREEHTVNRLSPGMLSRFLDQETDRLQKAIQIQEELTRPSPHQVGDEGDHALSHTDQGKHQAVVEHLKQLLSQVQAARERLAAGTYGICVDCERPIPPERLEALPYAALCVSCQSKREKSRLGRSRLAWVTR